MNISAWAIRNPVPTLLLFVLLTLFGVGSFRALGIQNFPDIELPVISVTAVLEGAAPAQLETEVARKIEEKVSTLGAVEHIRTTISDGAVQTRVEFQIDQDSDSALNDVRNAIDSIRSDLPADLLDPVVSKITTSGSPIITFAVESGRLDEEALSWLVDNEISRALLGVKGVGGVTRIGGVNREIAVDIDPLRLAALGMTSAELSEGLRRVARDASGGRGDIGYTVQSVRTLAAIDNAGDLSALRLSTSNGSTVGLDEVAEVRDTIAERSGYARYDGHPAVGFEISRLKGASEVTVATAVRQRIAELQQQYPDISIHEAFNNVNRVEDNYRGSMELLYEGALLAILVVWLFLRDWRATFVAATALPLSIIPTFAVMYFLDFSLNVLTLLSLALVVGILVDDAIVEIENIVRHLRLGKTPLQAATEAADEIGLAVIATTFTLIAVFLPTAFMAGVPGKFFRPFGMTAAIAVFFSLVVARLLTPMMAAYFLRPHAARTRVHPVKQTYLRWADRALSKRLTTVAAAFLFFIASLALIPLLPTGFIPAADQGLTAVKLELQPGTSLASTKHMAERAEAIIREIPEVTGIFTRVGSSTGAGPFGEGAGSDIRKATLSVTLLHRNDRERSQNEVEQEIRRRLSALPGTRFSVGTGEAGQKLQLILAGEEVEPLQQSALALEQQLRGLDKLGNITSSASLQRPEILVSPNTARAADLGLTTTALANAIRLATTGDFEVQLPKLDLSERQVPVRVRLAPQVRSNLDALRELRLATPGGDMVPLGAVASLHLGSGPAQIDRLDRQRNITIDVELAGRSLGDVQKEVHALPIVQQLPPGVSMPAAGDAERMKELFGSFGSAMLIGILCIYIVLVLLFHDFLQPATILAALPLSVGGAFLALLITHNSFSMSSMIGLLMLMGIVTKNSILLVEYAVMARREHGLARHEALIDACSKRAQPIVMTTIAMGAGMLPIALGLGAEPSFRSPMAIAVIGGLLTSTLLSLLVIPVVFTYVDDLLQFLKRIIGNRFVAAATHPAES